MRDVANLQYAGASSRKVIRKMKIHLATINLEVRNLEKSARFYTEVLGMTENLQRSHPPGFRYFESNTAHLTLQNSNGQPVGKSSELGFACDDLEEVAARLKTFGVQDYTEQKMGWGSAIETCDPDGHRIIIYRMQS